MSGRTSGTVRKRLWVLLAALLVTAVGFQERPQIMVWGRRMAKCW